MKPQRMEVSHRRPTEGTRLYPFYEVLTNPGTQWAGYNSFVERLYGTLTPDGVRALFAQY